MMDPHHRLTDAKKHSNDALAFTHDSTILQDQQPPGASEHLQVYLRVRPFTAAEEHHGEAQDCVVIEPPDTVLLKPPGSLLSARLSADGALLHTGQRFQFSQVFGPDATQDQLFRGTVRGLVRDVLEGGNSLVFTYGVTNAGKTYTFFGPDADPGLLPRSLGLIFGSMEERVSAEAAYKPQRCREFTRLTREQQAEEVAFKRNLLRQPKEADRGNASMVANRTVLEGASTLPMEDKIDLEVPPHTRFSVWVSFCEIYNESIHDLLEVLPAGAPRRTALRLSQDVKGNAFVKDLRWVQVSDAEEACKVMKLGKRNQSFSSTRLNLLSSRSHSIFSIRILRTEDGEVPRVHSVSELCLCDLAGSERCAKTRNRGERLKEAGNINTSLLTLGKCVNALRHNQQARLLQHVPFRESKLTHYLQGYLCGRGRACMLVNVNPCASVYDETLGVLRFSAVAQKVVVLPSRPPSLRPVGDETLGGGGGGGRRSSLSLWETSLEDVQEDEDGDEGRSLAEETMEQSGGEEDDEERDLQRRQENLLMEARVREEIGREFSQLISEMQRDFSDRLTREKEILEERAERRLEIFKNLIDKMDASGSRRSQQAAPVQPADAASEDNRGRAEKLLRRTPEPPENRAGGEDGRAQEEEGVADLRELLSLLEEERNAKGEALTQLEHQKTLREEALASLEEEKRRREEAQEVLAAERRTREEAEKVLGAERRTMEEVLAVERRAREEAEKVLAVEKKAREDAEMVLLAERRTMEEALAAERRAREEAEEALAVEKRSREEAEEVLAVERRTREEAEEVLAVEKRSRPSSGPVEEGVGELADEVKASELQVAVETRREEPASVQLRAAQDQIGEQAQKILEKTALIRNLTLEVQGLRQELQGVLQLREEAAELRRNLAEEKQKVASGQEQMLEMQQEVERAGRRLEELGEKMELQEEASRRQAEEPTEKLLERPQDQEVSSQKQLQELTPSSGEEAVSAEDLRPEVASSKEKAVHLEEEEKTTAALQKELVELKAQLRSLQRNHREALERHEEEENQAAQEARQREAERRRELLAVAHEAIAQKDEELEKKTLEISRLKESGQQDSENVRSLNLDLQRKEEEASDLREKLADYKKQMQQVQKQISAMKEEEKSLRQKWSDAEKSRKQLQADVATKDRTIQLLRGKQPSDADPDQTLQLYQKACRDLEAKEQVMEDMRLALTEQEDTQEQMEKVLEEKMSLVQELTAEVEKLKGTLPREKKASTQDHGSENISQDLRSAREAAAQARERLELSEEKQQAERRRWQEEKMSLIRQAKEAEDKRNQEMRRFAEDRERHARQQSQLESRLADGRRAWTAEKIALEARLREKDLLLEELRRNKASSPQEGGGVGLEAPPASPSEREAAETTTTTAATANGGALDVSGEKRRSETARGTKGASVSSRGSSGYPSVLESSEISTEGGRRSRFPQPELEISFSPLQPNRMALRRQGEQNAVTVKITRSARKRKSGEMEKSYIFRRSKRGKAREEDVEAENRRNTRTKPVPKLTAHQEEISSQASASILRGRKDGTLQKIGEFLQSSPTLLGSKAKKMMSLVSGRTDLDGTPASASSSTFSLRAKKNKRKLYRPEISSPMNMPSHPIITSDNDARESDHQIMKRRLRSRTAR